MKLTSPQPYWLIRNGLTNIYPALEHDEACDFVVVGAGITGALVASRLAAMGRNVVVIDRRHACTGSTSASTALIQYDVDVPLLELAKLRGLEVAQRAYRLCHDAVDYLDSISQDVAEQIGYRQATSIYLARDPQTAQRLADEALARQQIGLDVRFHNRDQVQSDFHIDGEAALSTRQAASCDPYKLAHHLLQQTLENGGRVYDHTEVAGYESSTDGVTLSTDHGPVVKAKWAIIATGFEARKMLKREIVELDNTYALVSEPLTDVRPWHADWMMWEANDPYLYLRITSDYRLLAGGEDDRFYDPAARDRSVQDKAQAIRHKVQSLLPDLNWETAFAWAGTFGRTKDSLPYIGCVPEHPYCYFTLGFGGNGMTFGAVAAQMVADLSQGKPNVGEDLFGFDRRVRD